MRPRDTELALMSLGLSRTSAIALSELIFDDDLDRDRALAWMKGRNLDELDLPILVREEIRQILTLAAG